MKRVVLLVVVGALGLGALPSRAHDVYKWDGNDVLGPIDIRGVLYDHRDGDTILKDRVFGDLQRSHLSHGNFMGWQLDTAGNDTPDYQVFVEYRKALAGYYCFLFTFAGQPAGRVRAKKRESSIRCRFPSGKVDGVAEHFNSFSYYSNATTGSDLAPNTGMYMHGGGSGY